jgi:hypothetical protein
MRENLTSGLTRGAGASLPLLYLCPSGRQKRMPSLRFAQAEKSSQLVVKWIPGLCLVDFVFVSSGSVVSFDGKYFPCESYPFGVIFNTRGSHILPLFCAVTINSGLLKKP